LTSFKAARKLLTAVCCVFCLAVGAVAVNYTGDYIAIVKHNATMYKIVIDQIVLADAF